MKSPFGRGPITIHRELTITMVINHLLNGMILQGGDGFGGFLLLEQKTVILLLVVQKSGINSPVEGKVVYFHCFAKGFLAPFKRWLFWGFLNHQQYDTNPKPKQNALTLRANHRIVIYLHSLTFLIRPKKRVQNWNDVGYGVWQCATFWCSKTFVKKSVGRSGISFFSEM